MSALRLFFALWPEKKEAQELHALGERHLAGLDCKPLPVERLHLTVLFLGNVSHDRLQEVEAAAATVSGRAFTLSLDYLGYWRRAEVGWLGPSKSPAALEALARDLRNALAATGFDLETRPFRPHVTLARKLAQPLESRQVECQQWQVDEFSLVRSVTHATGPEYSQLARFSLSGQPPPAML